MVVGHPKVAATVASSSQLAGEQAGQAGEATVATSSVSTPVLKARLRQPFVVQPFPAFTSSTLQPVSNGGRNGEQKETVGSVQCIEPTSLHSANGLVTNSSTPQGSIRSSDIEVEEEAALNLLTLACQR